MNKNALDELKSEVFRSWVENSNKTVAGNSILLSYKFVIDVGDDPVVLMLSSMIDLPNENLQNSRNDLRNFVAQILKVRAKREINSLERGEQEINDLFEKADLMEEPALLIPELQMENYRLPGTVIIFHRKYLMRAFTEKLSSHSESFRKNINYDQIFRSVLSGFPSFLEHPDYVKWCNLCSL